MSYYTAGLRAKLLPDGFESHFRARSNANIAGEIRPPNDAGGVNEEFGRTRDVLAVGRCFGMQDSVGVNCRRIGIGEERIRIAARVAQLVRFGR